MNPLSACTALAVNPLYFGQAPQRTGLSAITDVDILLPKQKTIHGSIVLEGQKIKGIYSQLPDKLKSQITAIHKAPKGTLLTPGLIDQHIHGGLGANFNLNRAEELMPLMRFLPSIGVTRILPTLMTGPKSEMVNATQEMETLMAKTKADPTCTQIEGTHLEGPFIHPDMRGSHDKQCVEEALKDSTEMASLLVKPHTKLITIAPEVLKPAFIKALVEKGIRVSVGHSAATAAQFLDSIAQGATGLTHVFNRLLPIDRKAPGPIPVAATLPKHQPFFIEMIGDGFHVHPYIMQLLTKVKGLSKRLILVSDAMQLAGLPENSKTTFGGQTVINQNGCAVNQEGNLAGSTRFVTHSIQNLVRWSQGKHNGHQAFLDHHHPISLQQAVGWATKNPAKYLGLKQLGAIKAGNIADLVLWDKGTQTVKATWINGQQVYSNNQ